MASSPRRLPRSAAWWLGAAVAAVAALVISRGVDVDAFATAWRTALAQPLTMAGVLCVYATAFVLRAAVWRRILPDLPFGHALAALHVSLGGNHVLPLRLGEPLRVTSVVRRAGVGVLSATASTVTLRAADVLAVGVLGVALGAPLVARLAGAAVWGFLALAAAGAAAGVAWLARLARNDARIRLPGPDVAAGTLASWILESVVIWQAARWAGVALSPTEAILVTAVTIAAQAVAIAPAGFGTYEAAASAALVAVGTDAGTALAIALTAHALKTAYALVGGVVAVVVPAPGLLGRLRLPGPGRRPPRPGHRLPRPGRPLPRPDSPWPGLPTGDLAGTGDRDRAGTASADRSRPVLLFLPAHNEQGTVVQVAARGPAEVLGHPVRVLVIDDGSADATAARAEAAGTEVIRLGGHQGLGAAVRRGLAEAVACDAAAVAFCDADGEYAPEELVTLVGPVLGGQADYVVGSRFAGEISRMLPHRRLGNRALTALLSFVARQRISDGQSGYRALSAGAAAAAEVVHDFNYAQVLTLDLLAKGFRYAEVPISYRFRETGTSYVRLGRYLRAVLPAVYREVNQPATPGARP